MANITSGVTGQNLIAEINDKLNKSSGGSVKGIVDFGEGIKTDSIILHNGDAVKLLEYISTTMPSGDFLSYCGGFGIKNLVVGTYKGNGGDSQTIEFKDACTEDAPNYVDWVTKSGTDKGLANWVIVFRLERWVDDNGRTQHDNSRKLNTIGFATRKSPFNMRAAIGYSDSPSASDIDYTLIELGCTDDGKDSIRVSNYYWKCAEKKMNGKIYYACIDLDSDERYGFNEEGVTYVYIAGV